MATKIGDLFVELRVNAGAFASDMRGATKSLGGFEKKGGDAAKSAEKLGAAFRMVASAAAATSVALATISVQRFAGLEKQLVRVGAVSQASADEMRALTRTAKDLGSSTVFAAQEAAEGMTFLAMAGQNATTIIGAMPATLQLAQAAAVDLGTAADTVTNIMAGFGFAAKDLGTVNDALVATFTGSNVTITELGEAFKIIGPVAKTLGNDFNEVAAAVGVLGNAGIKGSLAGTGLKRALTSLVKSSPQAAAAMKDLRIETADASRGFINLVQKLEKARAELGMEEFTGKLFTVFGERAGPQMAALVEQGTASIEKLREKIAGANGLAGAIQKAELETTTGQFKLMASAVDGLATSIGELLAPTVIQGFRALARMANVVNSALGRGRSDVAGSRELAVMTARRVEVMSGIADIQAAIRRGFQSPGEAAEKINEILGGMQERLGGVASEARNALALPDGARAAEVLSRLHEVLGSIESRMRDLGAPFLPDIDGAKDGLDDARNSAKGLTDEMKKAAEEAAKIAEETRKAAVEMANQLAGSLLSRHRVGTGIGPADPGRLLGGSQTADFAPLGGTTLPRFGAGGGFAEAGAEGDAFIKSLEALRHATDETRAATMVLGSSFPDLDRAIVEARERMAELALVADDAGAANADVVDAYKATREAIASELAERLRGLQGTVGFREALAKARQAADDLGVSFSDVERQLPSTGTEGAAQFADVLTGGVDFGSAIGGAIGKAAPAIGAVAGGMLGSSLASTIGPAISGVIGHIADSIGEVFSLIADEGVDPTLMKAFGAFSQILVPLIPILAVVAPALAALGAAVVASIPAIVVLGGIAASLAVIFGPIITAFLTVAAVVTTFVVVVAAIVGAFFAFIGALTLVVAGFVALGALFLLVVTGIGAAIAAVTNFVAALVVGPGVILGLFAAFAFLLTQTETFGKIAAGIGAVVRDTLLGPIDDFAKRLVFLVGLTQAVLEVFAALGDPGAASAELLFEALRFTAVQMLSFLSTVLSINNAFITVGQVLLFAAQKFGEAISFVAGFLGFDTAQLDAFVGTINLTSAALQGLRVDTEAMDEQIEAIRTETLEGFARNGQMMIDGLDDATDAASSLSETFNGLTEGAGNLPQFFRVARVRADASLPGNLGVPPAVNTSISRSTSGEGLSAAGGIFIDRLVVMANDVFDLQAQLERLRESKHRDRTASTNLSALGSGANG